MFVVWHVHAIHEDPATYIEKWAAADARLHPDTTIDCPRSYCSFNQAVSDDKLQRKQTGGPHVLKLDWSDTSTGGPGTNPLWPGTRYSDLHASHPGRLTESILLEPL